MEEKEYLRVEQTDKININIGSSEQPLMYPNKSKKTDTSFDSLLQPMLDKEGKKNFDERQKQLQQDRQILLDFRKGKISK